MESSLPANHLKLEADANKAKQEGFIVKWATGMFQAVFFLFIFISFVTFGNLGTSVPSPGTRVHGALYPSCVACLDRKAECCWEFGVIQARMTRQDHHKTRCELCENKDVECLFEWNRIPFLEDIDTRMREIASCTERRNEKNDVIFGRQMEKLSMAMENARQLLEDVKG